MKKPYAATIVAALLLATFELLAQSASTAGQIIRLDNPSFEGKPQATVCPRGWYDCGYPGETPPDIQSGDGTIFKVMIAPKDGDTYIGMVVRDNYTTELVGQMLNQVMYADSTYTFSIYLCRSGSYLSPTKLNPNTVTNYITPAILRIWGGDKYCQKTACLAISQPVKDTNWQQYDFVLQPKQDIQYITLEAYYDEAKNPPYNGNILMDDASDIVQVPSANYPAHTEIRAKTLKNPNPPVIRPMQPTENLPAPRPRPQQGRQVPNGQVQGRPTTPTPPPMIYKSLDTLSEKYIIPKGLVSELSDDEQMLFIAVRNLPISNVYLLDQTGLVLRSYTNNNFRGSVSLARQIAGTYYVLIELTDGNHTLLPFDKKLP